MGQTNKFKSSVDFKNTLSFFSRLSVDPNRQIGHFSQSSVPFLRSENATNRQQNSVRNELNERLYLEKNEPFDTFL